jgi:uncharacterized membrane protein YwaF
LNFNVGIVEILLFVIVVYGVTIVLMIMNETTKLIDLREELPLPFSVTYLSRLQERERYNFSTCKE